jgi:hypothetical protein
MVVSLPVAQPVGDLGRLIQPLCASGWPPTGTQAGNNETKRHLTSPATQAMCRRDSEEKPGNTPVPRQCAMFISMSTCNSFRIELKVSSFPFVVQSIGASSMTELFILSCVFYHRF